MDTVSKLHVKAPQASVSKELAQVPYVVARRKATKLPMSHCALHDAPLEA